MPVAVAHVGLRGNLLLCESTDEMVIHRLRKCTYLYILLPVCLSVSCAQIFADSIFVL